MFNFEAIVSIPCQLQPENRSEYSRISEPTTERTENCQTLPKGAECILFVNDEENILAIGSLMLSRLGKEVVTRSNSIDGLDLLKSSRIDLTWW